MSNIKADVWFASLVWQADLSLDNQALLNLTNKLFAETPGVKLTNQNGWQSENLNTGFSEIKNFVDSIEETIDQCCGSVELPKLNFQNAWLNLNSPGSYNTLHNHHGSILSGVYYIQAEEDQGNLEFMRDDDMQYYMPPLKLYNQFTSQKATYSPKTGKILIFPSWLKHQVMLNNTDKNRISIAFNYGV